MGGNSKSQDATQWDADGTLTFVGRVAVTAKWWVMRINSEHPSQTPVRVSGPFNDQAAADVAMKMIKSAEGKG